MVILGYTTNGTEYEGIFDSLFNMSVTDMGLDHIVAHTDLRYSQGTSYIRNGFVIEETIGPDYRFVSNNRTHCKTTVFEDEKHRIYDCGKLKLVWRKE